MATGMKSIRDIQYFVPVILLRKNPNLFSQPINICLGSTCYGSCSTGKCREKITVVLSSGDLPGVREKEDRENILQQHMAGVGALIH